MNNVRYELAILNKNNWVRGICKDKFVLSLNDKRGMKCFANYSLADERITEDCYETAQLFRFTFLLFMLLGFGKA